MFHMKWSSLRLHLHCYRQLVIIVQYMLACLVELYVRGSVCEHVCVCVCVKGNKFIF